MGGEAVEPVGTVEGDAGDRSRFEKNGFVDGHAPLCRQPEPVSGSISETALHYEENG
jgi:hypothetical protein